MLAMVALEPMTDRSSSAADGIAGIILGAIGALFQGLPAWSFWVAGVICLFISFFRTWRSEHTARTKLSTELEAERAQFEKAKAGWRVERDALSRPKFSSEAGT